MELSFIISPMHMDLFKTELQRALQNLYDDQFLNRSPLIQVIPEGRHKPEQSGGRMLRAEIEKAVAQLKPSSDAPAAAGAWRVYEILQMRYVDGLIVKEMESRLKLGGRQIRREIHRAVDILAAYLWEKWSVKDSGDARAGFQDSSDPEPDPAQSSLMRFIGRPEPHKLSEVLNSILMIFSQLNKTNPEQVHVDIPETLPFVEFDRSLFRQVILSIIVKAVSDIPGNTIRFSAEVEHGRVILSIAAGPVKPEWDTGELRSMLDLLSQSGLSVSAHAGAPGQHKLYIILPVTTSPVILIIDDDENALHLYRRYLHDRPYRVICIKDSQAALQSAEHERPSLIILDVLLPNIDGWEILQALKTNPNTQAIPVIICSALYQPDIAHTLGANGFIKKPVIQKDLVAALEQWLKGGRKDSRPDPVEYRS